MNILFIYVQKGRDFFEESRYPCPDDQAPAEGKPNDFIRDNMELFESFMREGYDRSYLSLLFESIWKNRDTLCILLGPNGDPSFLQSLREFSRERTIDEWNTEFPRYSRDQLNFLYEFVFPGFTNLMVSWFKNDHGVSAKEFTHRMERLGHYALLAVEEFR